MVHEHDFLARLGLDTSTDERAVRRAYARLLKQIDQETEAGRFQALREDYDNAIAWLAWRDMVGKQNQHDHDDQQAHTKLDDNASAQQRTALRASAEPAAQHASNPSAAAGVEDPAPAPASASDDAAAQPAPSATAIDLPDDIDPVALSAQVFQRFMAELPNLQHGSMEFDENGWSGHLRQCLADERLFNMAASSGFEFRVAYYLASGHQRGHEALFNAAVNVFGWQTDRQRLSRFDHAGARVDRAIDERDMFNAQPPAERRVQYDVLAALRTRALPHPDELRRLMPHLVVMAARFPVLMGIITDRATLVHWDDVHSSLPHAAASRAPKPGNAGASEGGSSGGIPWVFLVFIIGAMIRAVSSNVTPPRYDVPPPPIEAVTGVPYRFAPPTEPDAAPWLDTASSAASPAGPAPEAPARHRKKPVRDEPPPAQ